MIAVGVAALVAATSPPTAPVAPKPGVDSAAVAVERALQGICTAAGPQGTGLVAALQALDHDGVPPRLRHVVAEFTVTWPPGIDVFVLANLVDVASEYDLVWSCDGRVGALIADAKAFLTLDGERRLDAVVDHADAISAFDIGACGATFAELRWALAMGAAHVVVIDVEPRFAQVERCLARAASRLDPMHTNDRAIVIERYGRPTDPTLQVHVFEAPPEMSWAKIVAALQPMNVLTRCESFDPQGPVGRVDVVAGRNGGLVVTAPQVGIELCVRESVMKAQAALKGVALKASFVIDDDARAERDAFLAPWRAFMTRVCDAAVGSSLEARWSSVNLLLRNTPHNTLDERSLILARAYTQVHPDDQKLFVRGDLAEAGVDCPALEVTPATTKPASTTTTLSARACAAFMQSVAKRLRYVTVAQEAYRGEFDTYASLAKLVEHGSAMPPDFVVEMNEVKKSAFVARLTGTGPLEGEIWELTEKGEPKRLPTSHQRCNSAQASPSANRRFTR